MVDTGTDRNKRLRITELINLSDQAHANKQWDQVIEYCSGILGLDPNNAPSYANRGFAYSEKGDHSKAVADYSQAILLDGSNAVDYCNRGDSYGDMGEHDNAISDYSMAIKLDANLYEAYNNRGTLYNDKGMYDHAIADLNKAIELDNNSASAYYNRGWSYCHKTDYKQAIADFSSSIKLDDTTPKSYNSRGSAYREVGDYEKAIADFNTAIMLDGNYAKAYNNRGYTYFRMGEYDKALADYDQAIKLDSNSAVIYLNRGDLFFLKKDYENARSDYNQALKIDPKDQAAFMRIGYLRGVEEKTAEINQFEERIEKIEQQHEQELNKQLEQFAPDGLIAEYSLNMEKKEDGERRAVIALIALSAIIYSVVFFIWISQQSPVIACEIMQATSFLSDICEYIAIEINESSKGDVQQSPFAFFPLIFIATLLVAPIVWLVRMIRQDKNKYWALREDARTKAILTRMAKSPYGEQREAFLLLCNFYSQHHSADFIIDEQKKGTVDYHFIDKLRNVSDRNESK